MGDDCYSMKVFAAPNPQGARAKLVRELPCYMNTFGLDSAESESIADRSIVVGPAGRWIHIGDTAGTTETSDPDAFDSLALALSTLAPVVSLKVSDSAAIHLELREEGKLVDTFGNMRFPFYCFADAEEAGPYYGRPEAWQHLLRSDQQLSDLREAWIQASIDDPRRGGCDQILADTGKLLGLNQDFLAIGYTNDMDGVPLSYREYLPSIGVGIESFEEFHFRLLEVPANPPIETGC